SAPRGAVRHTECHRVTRGPHHGDERLASPSAAVVYDRRGRSAADRAGRQCAEGRRRASRRVPEGEDRRGGYRWASGDRRPRRPPGETCGNRAAGADRPGTAAGPHARLRGRFPSRPPGRHHRPAGAGGAARHGREPGLTACLAGHVARAPGFEKTSHPCLDFIASGTRRRDAPELLGSGAMADLVTSLRSTYDVIVLDTAPLGAGVDALALAKLA